MTADTVVAVGLRTTVIVLERSNPAPRGRGDGFYYERVPSFPDVYSVVLAESGGRVLVSDSFLALIDHNDGMPADVKCKALQSYPDMIAANFDTIMHSTFPDQTQSLGKSFEEFECTDSAGSHVTLEQDSLANPYVRVEARDKAGVTETFSVNRKFVEDLLRQEDMDVNRLISSITSFPFRLPEAARQGFTQLSREQLNDLILHVPAFQRQEIIRMPRFYREQAAHVMAALSNAPAAFKVIAPRVRRGAVAKKNMTARSVIPQVQPPSSFGKRYWCGLIILGVLVTGAVVFWMVGRRKR